VNGVIFEVLGAVLVGIGFGAFVGRRHLLWRIIALNVLGSGVFLLLLSLPGAPSGVADPVPQAMVLTGIVVTVAATALALALAVRLAAAGAQAEAPAAPAPSRDP
jgi:multicomponent Na+:H+ antiporter subunit C